jgi:hypothetical protein
MVSERAETPLPHTLSLLVMSLTMHLTRWGGCDEVTYGTPETPILLVLHGINGESDHLPALLHSQFLPYLTNPVVLHWYHYQKISSRRYHHPMGS